MLSYVPMRDPVAEICSVNSTKSRSIRDEVTVPRLAMTWEISLISSSSIRVKSFAAWSSPTASMRIAAFSLPRRFR